MSSCLSGGGGRAFSLGHEMIKSPSSSWVSSSSSPSFTDSSSSSVSISKTKARTPRKRPNQVHNEAAAILSSACPKIFPTKYLTSPGSFAKSIKNPILFDPKDLLMPFRSIGDSGFSLHSPMVSRLHFPKESFTEKQCLSLGEVSSHGDYIGTCDQLGKDFGDESILDDGLEESIDGIMGKLSMENECCGSLSSFDGTLLGLGDGIRNESRVMRNAREEDDWWSFPTVDAAYSTSDRAFKAPEEKKKKVARKKLGCLHAKNSSLSNSNITAKESSSVPQSNAGLLLKLNYGSVVDSWGEKGSPFLGDASPSDAAHARLAKIDLFSGGEAESPAAAISKEKMSTKNNSIKQRRIRKVKAADHRRRPKARFVKVSNTICDDGSNQDN